MEIARFLPCLAGLFEASSLRSLEICMELPNPKKAAPAARLQDSLTGCLAGIITVNW